MSNDTEPQRQKTQDFRPPAPAAAVAPGPNKTTADMSVSTATEIDAPDTVQPSLEVNPSVGQRILGRRHWDADANAVDVGPGPYPGLRRPLKSAWWGIQVLLGIAFLLPLLAALAAFPGISFIALGMMLAAQSEVARSGRLRDGFPLLPIASRIGTIGIMTLVCLVPVMLVSSIAEGQQIIARLSARPQQSWRVGTLLLQALAFVVLVTAIANGGSLRAFFWPFRRQSGKRFGWKSWLVIGLLTVLAIAQPGLLLIYAGLLFLGSTFQNSRELLSKLRSGQLVQDINEWSDRLLAWFRPWYHFTLAVKAAAGALCWLIVPTLLLGLSTFEPRENPVPYAIGSFIGGAIMVPVAAWLPLLQCHQATTGRFRAIFEVRKVREIICRAPLRWAAATILLYGLAVPLYLSKIVLPPADAFWLFTPLFILVIYPTRLLMGWVYNAGLRREQRVTPMVRWPTKLFMIPVLGLYSAILFLLPLISEAGPRAILENHAFLLPVPSGQF